MFKRRFLLKLAAGILISISPAALLAHPDISRHMLPRTPELQINQDREWAAVDHKRALMPQAAPASSPAKPAFHTSRRYRYLQAQNRMISSGARSN